MKIGKLVNETRVSKENIHYCGREGLLPRPRKLGKNVVGCNESCVGRIRLIKELQDQSFLRWDHREHGQDRIGTPARFRPGGAECCRSL